MTHDEFIAIVRTPEIVKPEYEADLKEMVELYPYFVQARLLSVKILLQSHRIHYASNLSRATIYCTNRRWLYYYLYPDKMLSAEPYQRSKNGKSSGDYFEMINMIELEGGDTKQSLKNLAERLKSARAMVVTPLIVQKSKKNTIKDNPEIEKTEKQNILSDTSPDQLNLSIVMEISESNAKKLIIDHKYKEAIEILSALNLNNPKKSVYFADQIRFLEKVIANSKK